MPVNSAPLLLELRDEAVLDTLLDEREFIDDLDEPMALDTLSDELLEVRKEEDDRAQLFSTP